ARHPVPATQNRTRRDGGELHPPSFQCTTLHVEEPSILPRSEPSRFLVLFVTIGITPGGSPCSERRGSSRRVRSGRRGESGGRNGVRASHCDRLLIVSKPESCCRACWSRARGEAARPRSRASP